VNRQNLLDRFSFKTRPTKLIMCPWCPSCMFLSLKSSTNPQIKVWSSLVMRTRPNFVDPESRAKGWTDKTFSTDFHQQHAHKTNYESVMFSCMFLRLKSATNPQIKVEDTVEMRTRQNVADPESRAKTVNRQNLWDRFSLKLAHTTNYVSVMSLLHVFETKKCDEPATQSLRHVGYPDTSKRSKS